MKHFNYFILIGGLGGITNKFAVVYGGSFYIELSILLVSMACFMLLSMSYFENTLLPDYQKFCPKLVTGFDGEDMVSMAQLDEENVLRILSFSIIAVIPFLCSLTVYSLMLL